MPPERRWWRSHPSSSMVRAGSPFPACFERAYLKKVAYAATWWSFRSNVLCRGFCAVLPLATLETFTAEGSCHVVCFLHFLNLGTGHPGCLCSSLEFILGSFLSLHRKIQSVPVGNVKETQYLFYPRVKQDKFHLKKNVKKLLGRNSNSFKVSTPPAVLGVKTQPKPCNR